MLMPKSPNGWRNLEDNPKSSSAAAAADDDDDDDSDPANLNTLYSKESEKTLFNFLFHIRPTTAHTNVAVSSLYHEMSLYFAGSEMHRILTILPFRWTASYPLRPRLRNHINVGVSV